MLKNSRLADPEKLSKEFDAEAVVLGKTVILLTMFEARTVRSCHGRMCAHRVRTSSNEQFSAHARGIIFITALVDFIDTISQPQGLCNRACRTRLNCYAALRYASQEHRRTFICGIYPQGRASVPGLRTNNIVVTCGIVGERPALRAKQGQKRGQGGEKTPAFELLLFLLSPGCRGHRLCTRRLYSRCRSPAVSSKTQANASQD